MKKHTFLVLEETLNTTDLSPMKMRRTVRAGMLLCVVLATAALGARQAAQSPRPECRARADALFEALSSGDADRFEKMTQANFAPDLLARRTPEQQRRLAERIKTDFGRLTLVRVQDVTDQGLALVVRGATGAEGRIELTFESAAPYRIAGMLLRVEAGKPGPTNSLPPLPINASMATAELATALDVYVTKLAADNSFSGVLLLARDGVPVLEKAWGLADRGKRTPNTPATRFNLGSINKVFTKTAVGQLIGLGKFSLGDSISRLVPDYPNPNARQATVAELLTHRAGIADFFGPAFDRTPKSRFRSNADYYRFVAPQPLLFEPGARSQYCNGCYVVLGEIIERVSGQRYEDYVAEHVYKPAGMTGAGPFQSDRLPALVARGYTRLSPAAQGTLVDAASLHGASGSAAGGGYATAADLLAFENAVRGGRLLDGKMTSWFFDGADAKGGRVTAGIGYAGGAPGINASIESDGPWSVIVLANVDPPAATGLAQAILRQLTPK